MDKQSRECDLQGKREPCQQWKQKEENLSLSADKVILKWTATWGSRNKEILKEGPETGCSVGSTKGEKGKRTWGENLENQEGQSATARQEEGRCAASGSSSEGDMQVHQQKKGRAPHICTERRAPQPREWLHCSSLKTAISMRRRDRHTPEWLSTSCAYYIFNGFFFFSPCLVQTNLIFNRILSFHCFSLQMMLWQYLLP